MTACCSLRESKLRFNSAYSSGFIFPVFFDAPPGRSDGITDSGSGDFSASECGAEIDRRFRGYDTKTPETRRSGDTGFGDREEADGVLLGATGGSGLTSRCLVASAMFRLSWATLSAPLTQSLKERRLETAASRDRTAFTSKLEYSFS